MKNILLVLLLFASSYATAQTLTVSNTTYNIVSDELLTIANSYAQGVESVTSCNEDTQVVLERASGTGDTFNFETRIDNGNGPALFIAWFVRYRAPIGNRSVDVVEILNERRINENTPFINDDGDFTYVLDPGRGPGDIIEVIYVDRCGTYHNTFNTATGESTVRVNGRPPKVRRPV